MYSMSISPPFVVDAEPSLSIVVPCYQEEQVLQAFHYRISQVIEKLALPCELLYIDDGSTDATPILLQRFASQSWVHCLHLSRNFGKEAALRAGLDHARGQALIFIDADLQDPPELIGAMVDYWLQGYDVVNMQRVRREGDAWQKRISANWYYRIMNLLLVHGGLPADVSDFRLIGAAPLAALRAMPERIGAFKLMVGWVGFRSIELPYTRMERAAGVSKWRYPALLDLALQGAVAFSRKPVRWYSIISVPTFLISGIWLLAAIVTGDASLLHALLAMTGLLCLGVAVLGEYVAATLVEVKRRPLYLLQTGHRQKNQHNVCSKVARQAGHP